MKKFRNIVICHPLHVEFFQALDLKLLHKNVTQKQAIRKMSLNINHTLPDNTAYLIDNKGAIHTITLT